MNDFLASSKCYMNHYFPGVDGPGFQLIETCLTLQQGGISVASKVPGQEVIEVVSLHFS